jgi:hypothetical protein
MHRADLTSPRRRHREKDLQPCVSRLFKTRGVTPLVDTMSPAAARRPVPAPRAPAGRADKYIHVTAKDSDSDSCIETGG